MKTISSCNDLAQYGIKALTGEACGLSYRLLYRFQKETITDEVRRFSRNVFAQVLQTHPVKGITVTELRWR